LGTAALVINPLSDVEFVALVHVLEHDAVSPSDLQTKLRLEYPRTIVRQRDLSGETTTVWYVYRDGAWTSN
jgi:hypothetical protein